PRSRRGRFRFSRPASRTACASRNSTCPFTLRSSSAAHCSRLSHSSGLIRSRKAFRSATRRLFVQRPGVQDGRRGVLAAEHDEKIRHHGGLSLLVQLHDVVLPWVMAYLSPGLG